MNTKFAEQQDMMRERLERAIRNAVSAVVSTFTAEQHMPTVAWSPTVNIAGNEVEVVIEGNLTLDYGPFVSGDAVGRYALRWGNEQVETNHAAGTVEAVLNIGGLPAVVIGRTEPLVTS